MVGEKDCQEIGGNGRGLFGLAGLQVYGDSGVRIDSPCHAVQTS